MTTQEQKADMNVQEQKAALALCLLSAQADGGTSAAEQAEIRRIAAGLGGQDLDVASLHQEVLTGRVRAGDAARSLLSPQAREQAFEMAACVCNADGSLNDKERAFLQELRGELGVGAEQAERFLRQTAALAEAPLAGAAPKDDADLDKTIHRTAILAGGLEILPQTIASLAIVPLQMRLVYKVGKRYGFELDRGHAKDFLATVGVGMASQVLDKYARRLVGRLVGGLAGGLIGGFSRQAAGSALAYATTYALGHAAKQYYAGGRKLSAVQIREVFSSLVSGAKAGQAQHAGDIERAARGVNPSELLQLVREG